MSWSEKETCSYVCVLVWCNSIKIVKNRLVGIRVDVMKAVVTGKQELVWSLQGMEQLAPSR